MMKKIFNLLFIAVLIGAAGSCVSDDDLPVTQPVQVNVFCYGDQTTGFDVVSAFRGETTQDPATGISTPVTILGDGMSLNDMDELEGAGALIQLNFYGDSIDGFQAGLYEISSLSEPANVSLNYSLDFDVTNTLNSFTSVDSGFIRVQPYSTGYAITIEGVDANGDEFHGIYLGNVNLIP